jgi:putative acetyltransferase
MNNNNVSRSIKIRPIEAVDNQAVADIIRQVMTEFGAVGDGFSITDPEVDDMFTAYAGEESAFFVVTLNDQVLGCGGIGPLVGGDESTCELKKMYFKPELRGLGAGSRLLTVCLEEARRLGYQCCYLETTASMQQAQRLYHHHGFEPLDGPMGATGHCGCEMWMSRKL